MLLLGRLVEYLQDKFEFPERLPIVYEKSILVQTTDVSTTPPPIVCWDSPLSQSKGTTCMYVNVVGIVTSSSEEEGDDKISKSTTLGTIPTMAMVVVEKKKSNRDGSNGQQQSPIDGLFKDSEKKILKHLDRGLDDFMMGKIMFHDDNNSNKENNKQQSYEDALLEALSDLEDNNEIRRRRINDDIDQKDIRQSTENKSGSLNYLDAEIVTPNKIESSASSRREAALKTMYPSISTTVSNNTNRDSTITSNIDDVDYAVRAAMAAVERKAKMGTYSDGLDFAVQAAKEAAAKRQQRMEQNNIQSNVQENQYNTNAATSKQVREKTIESTAATPINNDISSPEFLNFGSQLSPMISGNGVKRNLLSSISNPADFRTKMKKTKVSPSTTSPIKENETKENTKTIVADVRTESRNIPAKPTQNLKSKSEKLGVEHPSPEQIAKLAVDAMNEIDEAGYEMSPEELLSDIMKFSNDQDIDETPGTGFVDGAFKTAKSLLREQQGQKQVLLTNNEMQSETGSNTLKSVRQLTPEEELRQMFEAGERLAESRITKRSSDDLAETEVKGTTQEDIDDLINSDKTTSRYARILDEELVELQVRINKSPDETTWDGPIAANPLFDVLSGPEVYDRNVDPETAVNWPGARSGTSTKNPRLPKELDVAIAQSKFAAEVLLSIKEEILESDSEQVRYKLGDRELSFRQVQNFRSVVQEAVEIGIIDNPLDIVSEQGRLQMLIDELWNQPDDRFEDIVSNFKDLLLSDYFVPSIKVRCKQMAERDRSQLGMEENDTLEKQHSRERELLGRVVSYAQLLVQQARALGAELEVQQLEIIRSICKVAMDPSHQTEEETSIALSDAVRDMRPLFDDAFVAYLKFALAEEEGKLARAGLLDDPEHNQWLYVLKIVQQGVYAEIAKGINRYIDHIWYVLRMETPTGRRRLLEELIRVMPTMDVRPFVHVVDNIVGALGDGVRGDFDSITPLGEMTNKLLQLHRDTKELLPPDRIAVMSKDADEWVAQQKQRLVDQRTLTKQRLKAAQDTEYLDEKIEAFGKRGEVDRFD